ncbi:hypothetical protein CWATWH0005_3194 [Crocosphaera watsonii WH 0005]|uniref:Uncharacterized protein n=1 Tax=Crocosphaera watsonii WH 0005 TaxID=423472 RepID=T2IW93_CROWT|nr:hypothetical protein [Crocosphaera watsonii]CCQ57184.1 hypothetical protein CWATWH0005_3194 [Crocosphaera watsonii WH 0005]
MINLEEITIKISPELAQIYRQASTETQAQIQSKITALLESQIMSYHQEKLKNLGKPWTNVAKKPKPTV